MIWDDHAYVLVDLELVSSSEGCSMVRDEPVKHPENPVNDWPGAARPRGKHMVPVGSLPWCVHRDGGTYRMWYGVPQEGSVMFGLGYAESDDGIHFRPRRVGTVAISGSRNNNLVRITDRPDVRACRPTYDPLDPQFPLKCVVLKYAGDDDFHKGVKAKYPGFFNVASSHPFYHWRVWGLARSRDGFDWGLPTHDHLIIHEAIEEPTPHRGLDGGMFIGSQMISPTSDIGFRKVKGWVTYDGVRADAIPDFAFALPDHMTMVHSRWLGKTAFEDIPWVQSHVNLVCCRKGPTVVALHGFLYGNYRIERYAQVASAGLAVSSTGYGFRMVWPFHEYIRRGDMGAWDCQFVRQQALCQTDSHILMYYHGARVGNTSSPHGRHGVGVAMIAKDRFGYFVLGVNSDHRPIPRRGQVNLKPIVLPSRPGLWLNVSHVNARQTVRAELRDPADGRTIPGFALDQCRPLTQPGLRRRVAWKDADIASLAGQSVQVCLQLDSRRCAYADLDSPRVYALYTR